MRLQISNIYWRREKHQHSRAACRQRAGRARTSSQRKCNVCGEHRAAGSTLGLTCGRNGSEKHIMAVLAGSCALSTDTAATTHDDGARRSSHLPAQQPQPQQ